jgi:hypothetical protein
MRPEWTDVLLGQSVTLHSGRMGDTFPPADCKGEFMLADRGYYYPLMITDFAKPVPDQLPSKGRRIYWKRP